MSVQEEKTETAPVEKVPEVPKKEVVSPPKPQGVIRINRYGTPSGVRIDPKTAPFGYHPQTGEIIAPFGFRKGTNIPRKRRPPGSVGTANARSAYMRKKEDQIKNLVHSVIGKQTLENNTTQKKNNPNSIHAQPSSPTPQTLDGMPRQRKALYDPNPGNPGLSTMVLLGGLAALGFILYQRKGVSPPQKNKKSEGNNAPTIIEGSSNQCEPNPNDNGF